MVRRIEQYSLGADLDNKVAKRIDGEHIARTDHGRRCILLDERGPRETVAREKLCADVYGCRDGAGNLTEINIPDFPSCLWRYVRGSASDPHRGWLRHAAGHNAPHAYNFGGFVRRTIAVALYMGSVEGGFDAIAGDVACEIGRESNRNGMLLTHITHVDRVANGDRNLPAGRCGHFSAPLACHLLECRAQDLD